MPLIHSLAVLALIPSYATPLPAQLLSKAPAEWHDRFNNSLSRDEFSILIRPNFNNDEPQDYWPTAELSTMTMAQALDPLHLLYPADYDTRVQHILCYMREDPYSKNFKESERQYFPVKFPDGTEVKHPPLIIAPGHACTLWGQLHHRDYDNLQITFGNIFIDVPTEIRRYEDMKGRMGASEVDAMKAGRCRLPEKDVGPVCWLPRDGGV